MTAVITLLATACGGSSPDPGRSASSTSATSVPSGATPTPKTKVYHLYTHCGVEFAHYEGRFFKARQPRHGATRDSAPRGWGDPEQPGELVILDEEEHVRFRAPGLPTVDFYVTDEQPRECD